MPAYSLTLHQVTFIRSVCPQRQSFNLHSSKKGNNPLKVIKANDGNEFWTIAASRGEELMSLASQGMIFLISS